MICSAFQQQCSFPLCVITAQAANIPPWILRAVPLAKVIIPPQPRSLVVNIRWIAYYLIKDFICSPGSGWTLWTLFSPPTLNFPATSCTHSPIQFSALEWLTRLSRMESDLSRTSYSRHHLTASTDSAVSDEPSAALLQSLIQLCARCSPAGWPSWSSQDGRLISQLELTIPQIVLSRSFFPDRLIRVIFNTCLTFLGFKFSLKNFLFLYC